MSSDETVELPGSDDTVSPVVKDLIDRITDTDKVVQYRTKQDGHDPITVYFFHSFDDDGKPVYVARLSGNFGLHRTKLASRVRMEKSLQNALEAEVLTQDELEDDVSDWYEDYAERGHPLHEVHVFVKTTDDGRYKDDWDFYRGESEEAIREEWRGLSEPGSGEKFVYHHLGTVAEVLDGDFDADLAAVDFKQGGHSVPTDLPFMVEGDLCSVVKEAIEAGVNGDEQ